MSFCRAENLHCFLLLNRILKLSIPPEDLCSLSLPEPVHGLKTTPHGYAIGGGGGGGKSIYPGRPFACPLGEVKCSDELGQWAIIKIDPTSWRKLQYGENILFPRITTPRLT